VTSTQPQLAPDALEAHRRELTAYCYRMLGSAADAQDAVQEVMLRAWRVGYDESRASLRTWLYRIATNYCLDQLRSASRRTRPIDMGPAAAPVLESLGDARPATSWVTPVPSSAVLPDHTDPAVLVEARESVRLAFIAALQHLAPRQRAVLVLADVLGWRAAEIADLLDTSVAAVTSALQRARATMAAAPLPPRPEPLTAGLAALLARYVSAFEAYDVSALVALLREDATLSMPPFTLWLQGPGDIAAWLLGPGAECRGSVMVPVDANGATAWGQYRPDPDGGYLPWSLTTVETDGERITAMTSFLDTGALFAAFGLPPRLEQRPS
jgi:RNA polymerase sigma-70 factor (ECF subfamily)